MYQEIKAQIKYFVTNRIYMISLVLAAVVGYGYQLTHGTCGIDDVSINWYFEKGLGVAIGRWPFFLINKIIPIAEYRPFIGDFLTLLLLMLSAIMWCSLIRIILKRELSIVCYAIFSVMFLDYSLISEVFIFYLQNGLGFVYGLTALALIGTYYIYKEHLLIKTSSIIRGIILVCLTFAISFYESAANLYLSGVLLVLLLDLWEGSRKYKFDFKKTVQILFFMVRFLVYAMIIRRIIRAVLMRIFDIEPYSFYRSPSSITWLVKGGIHNIWNNISELLSQIFCDYFAVGVAYFPIFLFVMASLIFLIYLTWKSIQEKSGLQWSIGILFYLSMFALSFLQGETLTYRGCQIFTVFVAVTLLGFTDSLIRKKRRTIKILGSVTIAICICGSVYDLNKWFVLDYQKTEYEMAVIDEIAYDLISGEYSIENKPIVVVGDFYLPDDIYDEYCIKQGEYGWNLIKWAAELAGNKVEDKYCYMQSKASIIDWSVTAFAMNYGYNTQIKQLFEYCGYDFTWADQEVCREAFDKYYPLDREQFDIDYKLEFYKEQYEEEEQYPYDGYIVEEEKYIVIKL